MTERCVATNRQGNRCGQPAIDGGTVCRYHGGSTGHVRRKAAQRVIERRARKVLADLAEVEPVSDPMAALEDVAGQAVALVDVLRGLVGNLQEIRYRGGVGTGVEQVRGELQVYLQALARAESVLGRILSLDLDSRRVRLQEAQVGRIVEAVEAALSSPELALDPPRQLVARQLIAQALGAPIPAVIAVTRGLDQGRYTPKGSSGQEVEVARGQR